MKILFSLFFTLALSNLCFAQSDRGVKNVGVEQKIALVIGNTNYDNSIGKLTNPVNDANDMARSLQRLGFTLVGGKAQMDANRRQMLALIRDFGRQIKQGGVGFFYFSGHGVQVNKENYIIPITDALVYEDDAETEAIKVDAVTKEMELAGNRLNILVLDACRNNALQKRTRNTGAGLTEPARKPEGTFIAFSAGDGQTASDGTGKNGLFTQELLKNLEKPNLRLDDIFRTTRNEVKRLSNSKQIPIVFDSTSEAFTLKSDKNVVIGLPNKLPEQNVETSNNKEQSTGTVNKLQLPNNIEMSFVYIPAGSFEMGSANGETNEKPIHRVNLTHDFEIGETEVTQGQWEAIMKTTIRQQLSLSEKQNNRQDKLYGEGANYPMYYVSWNEVQEFVNRLNSNGGNYNYRLPTEAEWEYAARAGTTADYAGILSSMAWYSANSGNETKPVKGWRANPWGLHDMYGNVWEWVSDNYTEYSSKELYDPVFEPLGGKSAIRIFRGGSWFTSAAACRSATRGKALSILRSGDLGFRVLRQHK